MSRLFVFLLFLSLALPVKADGQPPLIAYGQVEMNRIVSIPDAVCGLSYTYLIDGKRGDVVSIKAKRMSGSLQPVIQIEEGIESPAISETEAIIERYLLTEERNYFTVAARHRTVGDFNVTVTYIEHQELPAVEREAPPVVEAPQVEIIRSVAVGQRPAHSVWDGKQLYVSNILSENISVLDVEGQLLNTIEFPGSPSSMQWDGERLWVADRTGDSVYLFDAEGQQIDRYRVGRVPISLSHRSGVMWIALYDDSQIVALDENGEELMRTDTAFKPSTILQATDESAWVTLYGDENGAGDTVIRVDLEGEIQEEYTLHSSPNDLTSGEGQVFVSYAGKSIFTVIEDGETTDYRVNGGNIIELLWVSNRLWLTLDSHEVVAVTFEDGRLRERIRLSTDARPFGMTDAAGRYLWVANRGTVDEPGETMNRIDIPAIFAR